MKQVHIKYFASLREILSCSAETVQTQAATLAELRAELRARSALYHQALDPQKAIRAALAQTLVQDEDVELPSGAEVAFFPPVTGG